MSRCSTDKITCPECGSESDYLVWSSINTVMDPEMKKKVQNGEAFQFKCSQCGHEAHVDYGFLYHQMEDHFMIYYVTSEKSFEDACRMMSGIPESDGTEAPLDMAAMSGYRHRVVTSLNSLREKIAIFDAGLDDRIVEIIKVFFYARVQDENSDAQVDELLFFEEPEGEYGVQLLSQGEYYATIALDRDLYDQVAADFEARIAALPGKDVAVGFNWAMQFFRE